MFQMIYVDEIQWECLLKSYSFWDSYTNVNMWGQNSVPDPVDYSGYTSQLGETPQQQCTVVFTRACTE